MIGDAGTALRRFTGGRATLRTPQSVAITIATDETHLRLRCQRCTRDKPGLRSWAAVNRRTAPWLGHLSIP
jgi:hypothetical protein